MKKRSIFYIIIMFITGVLSYLLIYNGIFTKNKIFTKYQVDSNIKYNVNLLSDSLYNQESITDSNMYISSKVDNIDFNLDYKILYNKNITGYYNYETIAKIIVYNEEDNSKLFERDYTLEKNTNILNENKDKDIKINLNNNIEYNKYREEILSFAKENNINISSYIILNYNINLVLNIEDFPNIVEDTKNIEIMIPLTLNTFKISTLQNETGINYYYDYSTKEDVNYLFLVLGALFFSIFLSFFILIIKNIISLYKEENKYKKELKNILNKHPNIIINIKKIILNKEYNIIYVDNFKELMDVYNKYKNPISYKEIKKNKESIFMIIENDNAWIYKLLS